jgi:hypothetical protein
VPLGIDRAHPGGDLLAVLVGHAPFDSSWPKAADDAHINPDRLTFIRSLRVIRRQVTHQAAQCRLLTKLDRTLSGNAVVS